MHVEVENKNSKTVQLNLVYRPPNIDHKELENYFHCIKNHIFFFHMFWKDDFPQNIALEYGLSCIKRKDDVSFSQNYDLIL